MAVGTKPKKGKVVVEKLEAEDHSETDTENEEPGDDMVEVKEEVLDVFDDSFSESAGILAVNLEVKSEDDDITEVKDEGGNNTGVDDGSIEIKEEKLDDDATSDGISEDSDIEFEDNSDSDIPKSKKKVKEKEEKHVRIMTEESDKSDGESDDESEDENTEVKEESDTEDKTGLANVMAQILATPGGNNLILSKAKKDNVSLKAEDTGEFELVDADGNVKKEVKIEVVEEEDKRETAHKKQLEREVLVKKLKLKPNIETDREKERNLRIIATQGVVQLFSAIEKHKAVVRKERSQTHSVVSREVMSSKDFQDTFYDILDKEGEKVKKLHPTKMTKREMKDEPVDLPSGEKKPKWSVFADNFYKEPTLQGWDLKSDDEDQ